MRRVAVSVRRGQQESQAVVAIVEEVQHVPELLNMAYLPSDADHG